MARRAQQDIDLWLPELAQQRAERRLDRDDEIIALPTPHNLSSDWV